MESWAGCIAGALEEETYRDLLREAEFTDIEIEVTRRYSLADVAGIGASASKEALDSAQRLEVDSRFVSASFALASHSKARSLLAGGGYPGVLALLLFSPPAYSNMSVVVLAHFRRKLYEDCAATCVCFDACYLSIR